MISRMIENATLTLFIVLHLSRGYGFHSAVTSYFPAADFPRKQFSDGKDQQLSQSLVGRADSLSVDRYGNFAPVGVIGAVYSLMQRKLYKYHFLFFPLCYAMNGARYWTMKLPSGSVPENYYGGAFFSFCCWQFSMLADGVSIRLLCLAYLWD